MRGERWSGRGHPHPASPRAPAERGEGARKTLSLEFLSLEERKKRRGLGVV